jgi:hypothetical protein
MPDMETQTLINIGFACAGIFGGWWMKIIWDSIQSLRADVKGLDAKMHEDFVRRDDFKDAVKDIKEDMKEGFKSINQTLGLLFKKLDGKEDK